jgi:hypothetical protein
MEKQKKLSEDFKEIFIDGGVKEEKKLNSLAKANDKYNSLISKGLIVRRGYTLRGLEDNHLVHFSMNDLNFLHTINK